MKTKLIIIIIIFSCLLMQNISATSCSLSSQPTGFVNEKNGDYTFRRDKKNNKIVATIENIKTGKKNTFPFSSVTNVLHLFKNGDFLTSKSYEHRLDGVLRFNKNGKLIKQITVNDILDSQRHSVGPCSWNNGLKFIEGLPPLADSIEIKLLNYDKAFINVDTFAVSYENNSFEDLKKSPDKMLAFVSSLKKRPDNKAIRIQQYQEILRLHPKHYRTVETLSSLLPSAEGIDLYKRYLQDVPLNKLEIDSDTDTWISGSGEYAYSRLANMYKNDKQSQEAFTIFQGLYEAGSRKSGIVSDYAELLFENLENDKAIEVIKNAWNRRLKNPIVGKGVYYTYDSEWELSNFARILIKNNKRNLAYELYKDIEANEEKQKFQLSEDSLRTRADSLIQNGFRKEGITVYTKLTKSSKDNFTEVKLAELFSTSRSADKDFNKAYEWYAAALLKEPTYEQSSIKFNLCMFKIREKKYEQAFTLCKSSVEAHAYNNEAKLWLSLLYLDKEAKHFDIEKGNEILIKLINKKFSIDWGAFKREEFFNENFIWAEKVLTKHAEAGSAYVQYALGDLLNGYYSKGENKDAASIWFEKSANAGMTKSMIAMGQLSNRKNDEKEAIRWFDMAIEHENYFGHFWLANHYFSNAKKAPKESQKFVSLSKHHIKLYNEKTGYDDSIQSIGGMAPSHSMTDRLERDILKFENQQLTK